MARMRRERGIARSHPEDLDVLVPRQGEVEAPVDRPASPRRAPSPLGGSPRNRQRFCQTLWQSQAGTRPGITPGSAWRRWP